MTVALAGVLGSPIKHSKSPLIHNHWLKLNNIKGLYVPIEIRAEDLPGFVQMAPRLGFVGFNVTIPHKGSIAHYCSELTETALRAGSVNTLRFDEAGEALGDSTDGYGFLRNLEEKAGWSPKGKTIAMFGAGGAARAVAAALIDNGAAELRVANRSAKRAEDLAKQLGRNTTCFDWDQASQLAGVEAFVEGADLLVNATSLGMDGGPEWRWALPPLDTGVVATDLIYAPLVTPFLETASAQGATSVDGLGMLLHQARPGFAAWYEVEAEVDAGLREAVLSVSD